MQTLSVLNTFLNRSFDLLFTPMRGFDPVWAMLAISLLAGVLMLWLFGKFSNQETIRHLKDKIRGNLIAVRLFQHDMGIVLSSQWKILGHTLNYMRYSLYPMLILMIPVVFIIVQLNLRFEARPLEVGERALVKVITRGSEAIAKGNVKLVPSEGIEVEAGPVRIPSQSEAVWRIRATKEGAGRLAITVAGNTIEKEVVVGSEGEWGAVSTLKTGKNAVDLFLYPGESPIPPKYSVDSIEILYPKLPLTFFGWEIHWLIAFFVLSVAFGFAFKKPLGIEV